MLTKDEKARFAKGLGISPTNVSDEQEMEKDAVVVNDFWHERYIPKGSKGGPHVFVVPIPENECLMLINDDGSQRVLLAPVSSNNRCHPLRFATKPGKYLRIAEDDAGKHIGAFRITDDALYKSETVLLPKGQYAMLYPFVFGVGEWPNFRDPKSR